MTLPRLTAKLWVSALIRRVQQDGGFATVLARGDEAAGGVLLVLAHPGAPVRVLQRVTRPDGFAWQVATGVAADDPQALQDYLDRQRRYDADLWIVELDIPFAERFIDEPLLDD